VRPPKNQPNSLPLPLSSDGIGGDGDGFVWRLGELIEAPKEASRRIPPETILGEPAFEGEGRLLRDCVGVPGRDVLDLEGDSPAAASVRRNSTHRRENDSVSSVFSSSKALDFEVGDRVDSMDDLAAGGPERCRPAFSRSSSVHCKIEDSNVSI